MLIIDAANSDYKAVNEKLRNTDEDCTIEGCCGQRFIAAGMSGKNVTIHGIPGNALGAYLNDSHITVNGNAQDAVGDTMNEGKILIYGNIGDAAGYAMRGGKIYVQGNAGYRAGIHMKAYKEKIPVMIIGGCAGSFLGEYQAGGIIIVLGLHKNGKSIVGNFPCTGMHGGKMFLRGDCGNIRFSEPGMRIWRKSVNICRNIARTLGILLTGFYLNPLQLSRQTAKIRTNRCTWQIKTESR